MKRGHFGNAFGSPSRVLIATGMALVIIGFVSPVSATEDARMLCYRGVKAYHEAHFAVAEGFFERAVRDAQLKGNRDEAAMSTANWVDVLLETGQRERAKGTLQSVAPYPMAQAALLFWKSGQINLSMGLPGRALADFDSAASHNPDAAIRQRLHLDRLRAEWMAGILADPSEKLHRFAKEASEDMRPGYTALAAEIALSTEDYLSADSLFEAALIGYREAHRYARAARLLWKQAACARALGHADRALRLLREAMAITREMGVNWPDKASLLSELWPAFPEAHIAKNPLDSEFGLRGERRDAMGTPQTGSQDVMEKSVSLPLDSAAHR
jgi:tetratricopeptide (TPR) repeat protein